MVIVDLFAQRDAIAKKTESLDEPQKLAWIGERGELQQLDCRVPSKPVFIFRSNTGIVATFYLSGGKMIFLGDHTTLP